MSKDEKIMAILNDELMKEVTCYQTSLDLMKRTHNPIKKMKWKKSLDMFGAHVAELKYAISRINRELSKD